MGACLANSATEELQVQIPAADDRFTRQLEFVALPIQG